MTKLHTRLAQMKQMGVMGDYSCIVKRVTRRRPWWAPDCDHFVVFLGRHAGGVEGKYWKKFQSSHAHLVKSNDGKSLDMCGSCSQLSSKHVVFMTSCWQPIFARPTEWRTRSVRESSPGRSVNLGLRARRRKV